MYAVSFTKIFYVHAILSKVYEWKQFLLFW